MAHEIVLMYDTDKILNPNSSAASGSQDVGYSLSRNEHAAAVKWGEFAMLYGGLLIESGR